ncbi:MAG: hypothetical protein WCR48_04960 [Bacteroidales bacterium]
MKEKQAPRKMSFEQVKRIIDDRIDRMEKPGVEEVSEITEDSGTHRQGFFRRLLRLSKRNKTIKT